MTSLIGRLILQLEKPSMGTTPELYELLKKIYDVGDGSQVGNQASANEAQC